MFCELVAPQKKSVYRKPKRQATKSVIQIGREKTQRGSAQQQKHDKERRQPTDWKKKLSPCTSDQGFTAKYVNNLKNSNARKKSV